MKLQMIGVVTLDGVDVYDWETKSLVRSIHLTPAQCRGVNPKIVISNSGDSVYLLFRYRNISRYSIETGELLATVKGLFSEMDLSPDDSVIAAGQFRDQLVLLNADDLTTSRVQPQIRIESGFFSFSMDSNGIFGEISTRVVLTDLHTQGVTEYHMDTLQIISPTNRYIIAHTTEWIVFDRLNGTRCFSFDVKDGLLYGRFMCSDTVFVYPSTKEMSLIVLDTASGERIKTINTGFNFKDAIYSFIVSPMSDECVLRVKSPDVYGKILCINITNGTVEELNIPPGDLFSSRSFYGNVLM
jgi:hypothetical protein